MFKLLHRKDINSRKWDETVCSSDWFRHYALSYFLDATCNDWMGLVWGDYELVWPVPVKHLPVAQVYQPLLAQQLGPYPPEQASDEQLRSGWDVLTKRFWKVSIKFNDRFIQLPFSGHSHTNVILDLNQNVEVLERGYNRNARSNIRRAKEAGLVFQRTQTFDERLIDMFRLGKGREIDALDKAFYRHVEQIYLAFEDRQEVETWLALRGGQLLGGVMLLTTNGRLLNFLTASSSEARGCGAMHGLFDAIIHAYAKEAYVLDFEGSNDQNLAFFYRSFGGAERVYLQAQTNLKPPLLKRMFK